MQLVEARFGRPIDQLLRELYLDEGLTQSQIAEKLGVRRATVSRWMQVLGIESRYLGQRGRVVA